MKILIVNQPPFNRGDESAHKGLVRTLLKRLPTVSICILCDQYSRESVRQYAVRDDRVTYLCAPDSCLKFDVFCYKDIYSYRKWLWKLHPRYIWLKRIYKWADVVLCAPGGICMGGFQDWNHLFHLKLAQIFKKPLAYYSRSFGPFPTETMRNREFKKNSLDMLHYFSFLSIRDRKTELLAEKLNVPYISSIDTAFLDSPKVEIPYELQSIIGNKSYMVFVPNYLLWHYVYKGKISHETIIDFYSKLMDVVWEQNPELSILMLPQLFGGYNYELNDLMFFRELAKVKNDSRIIVTPDCYSSDVQQCLIANAKYLIGARYHSIVFALNQGIPCIALSYEHKIAGLLEKLGKSDWCIDFTQTFDSDENQRKCLMKIHNLIPLLQSDIQAKDRAKNIADNCMNLFIEYLHLLNLK